MTATAAPAHWLRHNQTTRLPRRHVIIDTEAHRTATEGGEVQTFRLGAGAFDRQDKAGRPWAATRRARFDTPGDMWEWVDGCTTAGRRTVLVAHNLAYDLRVGQAFTILPALGWQLRMIRLDGGQAWAQWRRGDRSLAMVDTVAWFGCGLDKVGQLLGMTKPALPDNHDDDETWFARCEADVEILRRAWRLTLDWIEGADLGNWKPTGAGQGWAAFKHKHLTDPILHHAVTSVAKVEREAAWTGRCEAWQHGRLKPGVWSEYDYTAAYARVALAEEVPTRLQGHLGAKAAGRALDRTEGSAALLKCRVTTDVPVAPARGPDGIVWPVGSFTSWLWDVEAAAARDAGATVEPVEGWRYQAAPALRQWASWVLDLIDAPAAELHPLLRLVAKGWSRTTIGRFGSRWSTWDDFGEAHGDGVVLRGATLPGVDGPTRLMMVGGRCMIEGAKADAPDGAVHVMSWIVAAARVRLWQAMVTAGLDHVAYVDTDSVMVDEAGALALDAAQLPGLRVKGRWRNVEVLGPRQLVLSGKLRAAGIPLSATRRDERTWDADVWRGLAASLRQGETDRVVIRERSFTLTGRDSRRVHGAGGLTAPVRL